MRSQKSIIRRPERHTVRLCCQVVREHDFRLVADRVENLSTWGMLVSPAEPVLTGERVFVSFQIPGTRHYIDTMATVTRGFMDAARPNFNGCSVSNSTRCLPMTVSGSSHRYASDRWPLRAPDRGVARTVLRSGRSYIAKPVSRP
ncbi:MAG TPA: PilZ domain-containing protein [Polyangiaceae bacterium]|nr:PilZ domain-containing protein [Polyangiaceae bacterium]